MKSLNTLLPLRWITFTILVLSSMSASADIRSMGVDYRQMLSNYYMLGAIKKYCPEIEIPTVVKRSVVEEMTQKKLGMNNYMNIRKALQTSDIFSKAEGTIDTLFERITGCKDPALNSAITRLTESHSAAFARFEKEPALNNPSDIPIPYRPK